MKRVFLFAVLLCELSACAHASTATPPTTVEPLGDTVLPLPSDTVPAGSTTDVLVYFSVGADETLASVPVPREVPASDDPVQLVQSTLDLLVQGPTDAEKAAGLISWFSPATAGVVTLVSREGGAFAVDFHSLTALIPNASTSAGSQLLLSQLNGTIFQFAAVDSVLYTLDGDCDAFWMWLQMECHPVTRVEWEGA
jgi:hypothetical protein